MKPLEGWPWQPDKCPADEQFIEWLQNNEPRGPVLHMGTGLHHKVGLYLQGRDVPCIGLTASPEEAIAYYKSAWAPAYQVLLDNVFTVDLRLLPSLQVLSLFHLGEMPDVYGEIRDHDNAIDALIGKVDRGGFVLFYSGSSAWQRVRSEYLLKRWEMGSLTFDDPDYKSLIICRRAT